MSIPFYTRESFARLQEVAEDEHLDFSHWEEWQESMEILELHLKKHGIKIREVYIDIDELEQYCRLNNVKNIARIRAQFALLMTKG